MKNNDETILEVLQGHKITRWPAARLVRVFIASTKPDFIEERRRLLEVVGPELQALHEEHQIEVELVDMHFGASEKDAYDPRLFDHHLDEIRTCHKNSRGCFFLCLIGNKYQPYTIPVQIETEKFLAIVNKASDLGLNCDILRNWYEDKGDHCVLREYRKCPFEIWKATFNEIINIIHSSVLNMPEYDKMKCMLQSGVEQEFMHALGLAPGTAHHMLCVIRDWSDLDQTNDVNQDVETDCKRPNKKALEQLNSFRKNVKSLIPEENQCYFIVPWKPNGIDPEEEDHETYLKKFKNTVLSKLQNLIKKSLEDEPELKSRKKIVQENFQENLTHLTLCFGEIKKDFENSDILERIKSIVLQVSNTRHTPIFIYGNQGSGKTSLIQTVYKQFENWFSCRLLRIIRFVSSTPRSSYQLELLRIICQQICIALKLPDGFLPKDASFDPLYINNWFQTLLRNFEEMNQVLAIFIDDLHLLNPLDSDIISALSWVPINLPRNVYLICTTGVEMESLRLNPVQKERFRNPDNYLELPMMNPYNDYIDGIFNSLEGYYSCAAVAKLSSLITCSEFGLTETEYLEILMPTSNSEAVINIEEANFNFSSFSAVKRNLRPLIREKLMSGKLVIEWSHLMIKESAKKRYLSNQEILRNTHTEIANLFFNEFTENENSESEDEPAPLPSDIKETPFQSTLHSDVTYSLRHVEESWIHLLKAGDILKLKTLTLCNYDFLLAAVQTVSISYLRCILEHARCYLLDREIELVYHTIKRATDVLTRDTFQLGTQIISWLRPVSDQGGLMASLVTSAMAWCDGFTLPLVVPLTDWLQPPLPPQSRSLNATGVRLVESTPSGQHVICVANTDPQLWHIMTNQLVHTFRGHTSKVLCMAVTKQSQYLLTGSEDISIIVWDLRALTMRQRIHEHIAPVLCITCALNNSVIVSGAEDSSIIITSLANGHVVMKMDHHRGPVTSVKVTSAGDVLVSGSQDGTACLWSLENFQLLNTIFLQSPLCMIDVSADSVFLLAACADNNLYLRTLATGTELHCLVDHRSRAKSICLTQDSYRAVVGCSDGRVYIYSVHSGRLTKTLTGQTGEVTAVRVTDKDDFLLTAGGNRVLFYPFRSADCIRSLLKVNKKSHHLQPHKGWITCVDISRDGLLSATGAADHLVNLWQLNSHELLLTLDGHSGPVTCISFAPNNLFVASGSEDKTVRVWGLTLGSLVSVFRGHQATVVTVFVMMDSSRIVTSDRNDTVCIWLADNGNLMQSYSGPAKCVRVTNNMKYMLCTNGDTLLKIWSLIRDDEKYTVNHSKEITCFVLTMDSQFVITGSRDTSLKVWQVAGGKLSQVLIGHADAVTCVAVSISDKSQVISGSCDNNLIVWDINTGSDLHTLSAHLSYVTCVKLSGDGTTAISGSDDKSIIIWDAKQGLQLTSLQLHLPVVNIEPSSDFSRISVLLKETQYMPIICLHNTPAKYVKLPTYCAPDKDMVENPKTAPKRQMRRLLKKEVSLDTYTWQKKYAHLTSNVVIPSIDERYKRRFSVSASMEEISKIPQNSQGGMGSKGASLAQSQHFDQLEALWNKRSPPRRRLHQSLSKQSSLAESQLDSSEEEDRIAEA